MGREAKRNEDARKLARKVRDQAHQAFVQSFAVLSNALAVSVVITEPTGSYDEKGIPEGQTLSFTVCHSAPEIGLGHLNAGAELLHRSFVKAEDDLLAHRDKAAAAQAASLPTPEGMEEGPSEDETRAMAQDDDDHANRKHWDDGGES